MRCIYSVSNKSAIGRSYLSIICPASNGEQAITMVTLSGSYRNGRPNKAISLIPIVVLYRRSKLYYHVTTYT